MSARPSEQPLPALTRAECRLVDSSLDALDDLGRFNPARGRDTYAGLRAAQALVRHATDLRDTLALMHQRGEDRIDHGALVRALRVLDGELRATRAGLRRRGPSARGGVLPAAPRAARHPYSPAPNSLGCNGGWAPPTALRALPLADGACRAGPATSRPAACRRPGGSRSSPAFEAARIPERTAPRWQCAGRGARTRRVTGRRATSRGRQGQRPGADSRSGSGSSHPGRGG